MEVIQEPLPAGGVLGLEQGDVDKEGVIDLVALDKGGVNVVDSGISLVEVAALGVGDGARPQPHGQCQQNHGKNDDDRQ